ncbi:MAG: thioredoxin fold domain-containing protein [Gammaproteobacteria bacterium]|nr:thioredoxin fold domain-containing protein [Gammaproteobacteria bacterium]
MKINRLGGPAKSIEWNVTVLVVLALFSIWNTGLAQITEDNIADGADTFFDVSFGDLQEEAAIAIEEGKKGVLIMFETKDCPWCMRMKQQVLNRVSVQDYFHENFRVISVDAEGDVPVVDFNGEEMTSKDFALKSLRVRATPVFAFFDASGSLITRYTGALKNAHDFLLLGRFVTEGHYHTERFNRYRRANQPG